MSLGPNKVERLINAIRRSNPDSEYVYTRGLCFEFFLILRSMFPEANAYYSQEEGHVWTEIDGKFYDIYGMHFELPKDIEKIDWTMTDKPSRWSGRFEFNCWQAMRIRERDKKHRETKTSLFNRCRKPEDRKKYWQIGIAPKESLDKAAINMV